MVYHVDMDNQELETLQTTDKTIAAQLDLDMALETFREAVEPLVSVTPQSDWDGPKLLEREKAILKAGLVLVGQCIALLLFNLVSLPEVQQTARARTAHLRQSNSTGHGKRKVNILLIGGVVASLWVEYVIARKPRQSPGRKRKCGKHGAHQGQGFYPVLKLLGISERMSPLVRSTIAEHGTLSVSFEAACETLAQMGIVLPAKRAAHITHAFNQAGLQRRQAQLEQFQQGLLPVGEQLRGKRVVISVDGGRTRLRRPKRGRKAKGKRYHGYHAEWKEPKLLTIYTLDEQGQKVVSAELPITNDGTFEDVEGFMLILEMHLIRLGVCHAKSVQLIADGAPWIWQRIPTLLRTLGCSMEIIVETIDFYHAAEKLNTFAQLAFGCNATAQRWFKQQRGLLKQGRIDALLRNLQVCLSQAKGTTLEAMQTIYDFFVTHQKHMAYKQLVERHLLIGSGAIESLIRQVVNLRLKDSGRFWLKEHAEAMLHARCWWAAGTWEYFRNLVLTVDLLPALTN